ncbi:hypothetical protein JIG36_48055 [Actinoplanes sp. LDG1-06]|uniref:Uncharacterized protein n=1 Tax=Paractinoplanes ovalisporus TaxID=2810368 RepID=A0ABS2ATT0_9ACTN|nr:hypothetical protein [Actinoplanes ovalisporus]MBM2623278.1 hypothetical protein [Actinoplanes ovalisporus]
MAYDYLAESRRLIADGLPDRPVRLSRRHRFAALAVDVDGAMAATRFVRRGVACHWDDTHVLTRGADGLWWVHGGGGGSSDGPWSTAEFERARAELEPGAIVVEGGSGVMVPPWIQAIELLVGRDAATVRIDDRRELQVPPHGRLVVVSAERCPQLSTHDAAGNKLAEA